MNTYALRSTLISGIVLFRAGVRVPVLELRVTSGPPATPLFILYKTLVFKLKVMSDPAELVCPLTPRLKPPTHPSRI